MTKDELQERPVKRGRHPPFPCNALGWLALRSTPRLSGFMGLWEKWQRCGDGFGAKQQNGLLGKAG